MTRERARKSHISRGYILYIVLVYAIFAALWILLSDKTLEWLFQDTANLTLASTLKGWVFVVVTSLLLYGLMRRLAASDESAPIHLGGRSLFQFLLLAGLIVLLAGAGISLMVQHEQEKALARLQVIADLKSRQISDWRVEREKEAALIQSNSFFTEQFQRWQERDDQRARDALRARLEQMRGSHGFSAIELFDPQGRYLLGTGAVPERTAPDLLTALEQVRRDRQIHQAGPYRHPDGTTHLDFVVPLVIAQPAPCLVLHIDLAEWLYPVLQTWPIPSDTGDTVLFRRDGDQVQFLNQLRHHPDAAMNFRLPLGNLALLSAQVLRGEARQGALVKGLDYRDEPAIGVVRAIAGTDWFLLAKVDRSEFLYGAIEGSLWIGLAGLLALLVAGAGLVMLRQREQLLRAESARQAQTDRLHALKLLGAIVDASEDAIFALDLDGRFILFNRAAQQFTGKTAEEVLGQDERVLFPAAKAEQMIAANHQVMTEGVHRIFEEVISVAGSERFFHTGKGPLRDERGEVMGLYGVSRDITERKDFEVTLQRQTEELAQRNEELERFNRATVGRELDMIELKRQINTLSRQLGQEPPYPLNFLDNGMDRQSEGRES
ncbi:PAS domain-containing protein [Sedimenticola hydrogenitrophicus]|uniref:PAS domain-containing protein n=1 Tax=Sedimenticola hydrogenitrophicus TaxID=2967975 RepID=UPI0021A8FDFA|nr:PAS domain-containing protein [Sedimenticola hydrogenitrophicus]